MRLHIILGIFFFVFILISCKQADTAVTKNQPEDKTVKAEKPGAKLEFSFELNKKAWYYTNFGEPPQIAIWLEYPDSTYYRTVWVTRRAGKNKWKGKIHCPVALPYWDSRRTSKKDDKKEKIDAISAATPKAGSFKVITNVPPNSRWLYYIEVNASGDFNAYFKSWTDDGIPDSEVNGQPSLVYGGEITADGKNQSKPVLLGRTDQLSSGKKLYRDLQHITTAAELLQNITVKSVSK
ncbi:MAG TPA: DUF2271 domain-containing protein [Caldithrix abyssi]|uniref:DUF2271 domain-containing protein n=1 Tax=Caldithrix abyssi TaxID=187145 RepID=A0A7V4U455_CALAY|nr:DUF2271 domain-containing protein [Caldithrix abyssi]